VALQQNPYHLILLSQSYYSAEVVLQSEDGFGFTNILSINQSD